MSVEAFSGLLGRCDVSPTGKRWFPVEVGRYASHLSKSPTARLAVDRETVIGFLRSLRDAGVPAWQRLQAGCRTRFTWVAARRDVYPNNLVFQNFP